MSGTAAIQSNGYVGNPPRAWLRVTVGAAAGPERELCVFVDTGNPCALIVGLDVFREFHVEEAEDIPSNFGLLQGGWFDVTIPEVGFRGQVQAYGNDHVAAAAEHSDSRFLGLAGLPLLRRLQYGDTSSSIRSSSGIIRQMSPRKVRRHATVHVIRAESNSSQLAAPDRVVSTPAEIVVTVHRRLLFLPFNLELQPSDSSSCLGPAGQRLDAQNSMSRFGLLLLLSSGADPRYIDTMSETATLDTESAILEQVIAPDTGGISPETAQALLRFRFNAAAVARMNELAEKNRQGAIAPAERALLERYVRVGNFINLIHAKARCALAQPTSPAL